MKKYFVHNVVASLLLSSSVLLAMDPEVNFDKPAYTPKKCTADFAAGVKEINPYLYIGQKEPGLYLVMERIDTVVPDSRLPFWKYYIQREWINHDTYKGEWQNGNIPNNKGFLQFLNRSHRLVDGLTSFDTSVNYYNSNNELWIAYTSTKPIIKADEITFDDMEIVMPIMTDKDAPMVTYMGISRSFHYLLNAVKTENERITAKRMSAFGYSKEELLRFGIPEDGIPEDKFKVHPRLAMSLQSMAAKVMRIRDEKKLYQINAPISTMRNLMLKALPNHAYVRDLDAATALHKKMKDSGELFLSSLLEKQTQTISKKYNLLRETSLEKDNDLLIKMQKIKNDLSYQSWAQKKKEIDELYEKTAETVQQQSPFKKIGETIQIFDKERKVVFEHNSKLKTIFVNNQTIVGDETNRYDWFYHKDMVFNSYVTVDLDVLAEHLKLLEDK